MNSKRIRPSTPGERLARLKNIGAKTAAWLVEAGVEDRDRLAEVGAIEACRRMRAAGHPVTVIAAYAIEGALMDVHWNAIPHEFKRHLVTEFRKIG